MLNAEFVRGLLEGDESPTLEFKREWYWTKDADETTLGAMWGEFFKDLIALCNGYLNYVGSDRYLIVGYCEKEKKVFDVDAKSINALRDMRGFRKKVIERLERLVVLPPLTLQMELVNLDGKDLLVVRIPSPKHLTELRSELQTKTRTLDSGAVLIRKGQEQDSVRTANPTEILELSGEFDRYKNLTPIQPVATLVTKERSIAKTVQLYIEKNSSFSIDLGYPKAFRERSDGIIFELFKISEELGSSKYFLYLHEHASQAKTYGYIKKNKLIEGGCLPIILTERPSIKDAEKRKENISSIFGVKHVYFIDEFGLNYLYGDCIQHYESYNLPVFVESLTDEVVDGNNSALRILHSWYDSVASPLMVIKGYGGIGKSTLAKQFLDKLRETNESTGLLFIDSNEIIDRLSKVTRGGKTIDDLYDFYIAQHQNNEVDSKNFSKELLKLSVDNGNLFIVLDGIDEVIARLGSKFDVGCFLNSILEGYSNNLERGKVLITCRDNFWRELEDHSHVREITLTPFNVVLARDFFTQAFANNASKVERAMALADKFAIKENTVDGEDSVYIPYVLDMIAYLIKHKQEFGNDNIRLARESYLLSPSDIPNDFLIGSVCEREIKKLDNCQVDDQINFLIDFSAGSSNGHVSVYAVKHLYESATSLHATDEIVEKLKDHPLLSYANNALNFRYDFFNQYFKVLNVARYFKRKDVCALDTALIEIFAAYIGFDNDFSRSLCARLKIDVDLMLFSIETIDSLRSRSVSTDIERGTVRAAIAGVFMLLLSLKREETSTLDISSATDLLKEVFSNNGVISGACLVGVQGSERSKVVFDFRGQVIAQSHFEQYEYFWDCLVDEKTRFQSCNFLALDPRTGVKPKIYPDMFDQGCDVSDILDLINKRTKEASDVVDELKERLYQFFKLFYKAGNFYPKKQEDVRARLYTGNLLPILLKNKVVFDYQDPKKAALKQYKITEEFRPIIKLFEQGGACLEFERVVEMFR